MPSIGPSAQPQALPTSLQGATKNEGCIQVRRAQIRALIMVKEEIIKLRGQVQLRFFSQAADNLGLAQRILVLQAKIRDLGKDLVQKDFSLGSSSGGTSLLDAGAGFLFQSHRPAISRTDLPVPPTQTG